jgi:hypothetical protein
VEELVVVEFVLCFRWSNGFSVWEAVGLNAEIASVPELSTVTNMRIVSVAARTEGRLGTSNRPMGWRLFLNTFQSRRKDDAMLV